MMLKKLFTLMGLILATTLAAVAQDENLASGKTASASASNNGNGPEKAIDGNENSFWGSPEPLTTEDVWWQLDLGEDFNGTYNTVQIVWEGAYSETYELQFSTDGNSFGEAISVENTTGELTVTTKIGDHTQRYIRVVNRKAHVLAWEVKIKEFRLFNVTGQTLTRISVSPQLVRQGQPTMLSLKAYDQFGLEIEEGVAWSTDKGDIKPDNSLTPTANGVVTVSATLGEVTKTTTLYAYGDADAPRIPTDIYLPVYTAIDDNSGTQWDYATAPTVKGTELKIKNRPMMPFSTYNSIVVGNTLSPFKGLVVDFNPKEQKCQAIKADVFVPHAGVKARLRLEGAYESGDYVTLNEIGWHTLAVDVDSYDNIRAIRVDALPENGVYPDLALANIYFTKQLTSNNGPTWTTEPTVASKDKTSATITMKATDDISETLMYTLTDTADKEEASTFLYKKMGKDNDVSFTLTGLTPGKTYTYYATVYDEGGLGCGITDANSVADVKEITFSTDKINIARVDVTPKSQYVHGGERTEPIVVTVTDSEGNTYTEGFSVAFEKTANADKLTDIDGTDNQWTTATDVDGLTTVVVRVSATSGETTVTTTDETDARIIIYKDKQFNITYKVGETVYNNVNVTTGQLDQLADILRITELTVNSGFMNNDDLRALRRMAGARNCLINATADDVEALGQTPVTEDHDELPAEESIDDDSQLGSLSVLNLQGATFVTGGEPFAKYSPVIRTPGVGTFEGVGDTQECKISDAAVLPDHLFANCVNLTSVTLPKNDNTSVTAFEGSAHFAGCTRLTEVKNFDNVAGATPQYAFYASGLTSFDLAATKFDEIGASAFRSCQRLQTVTFPTAENSLRRINFNAFQNCPVLNFADGFTFPEGLTHIDNLSFKDCPKLTGGLVMPKSLEYIGQSAFENDAALKYVTLPNGDDARLAIIENAAFQNCFALTLTNSVLPNSLTRINNGAFKNCISLGLATQADYSLLHKQGDTKEDGTKYEAAELDNETVDLKNGKQPITLPAHLEYLGYEAFGNCRNLDLAETAERRLPATCAEIDNLAFTDCVRLTGVITFPAQTPRAKATDGTTTVRSRVNHGVFQNCKELDKVIVPEGIEEIDANAFASSGIQGDEGVVTLPKSVVEIGANAYGNTPRLQKLQLPDQTDEHLVVVGNTAFQWSAIKDLSFGENVVIQMGTHVFFECPNITDSEAKDIMAHEKDGQIRNAVFYNCRGLKDVVIPDNVTLIDRAAFSQPRSEENPTPTIRTITVTANVAPTCIAYTGSQEAECPFFGLYPNETEIVFDGSANDGYTSYRNNGNQSEWMRLLTKTASEGSRADVSNPKPYDVVRQLHGDFILTRTFDAQAWNTLVLPFMVMPSQLKQTLGAKAEGAYFTQHFAKPEYFRFDVNTSGNYSAFKPMLVWIENATGGAQEWHFEDVNVNFDDDCENSYQHGKDTPVTAYGDGTYIYKGTYELTTSIPINSYVIVKNKGYWTSSTLKAASQGFRAWLEPADDASAPAGAKVMDIVVESPEGTATGIVSMPEDCPTPGNLSASKDGQEWLVTLSGQKAGTDRHALPKGIYIMKGRKVVNNQ